MAVLEMTATLTGAQTHRATYTLNDVMQAPFASADDNATVYSRMFAPCFGIPEDPATGAASGPLGAYLLRYNAVPADAASRLVNHQGVRMGRPSRICIALSSRAGVLEEVRVGGEAVVVGVRNSPRIAGCR